MPHPELEREISYGLENLTIVHDNIVKFAESDVELALKTSAIAYECLGYYNAVEHLMIRLLKHSAIEIPTGAFSHRDTLKAFQAVVAARQINAEDTMPTLETLMAFRHVATKIYGFLIDWQKLQTVVADIRTFHPRIVELFRGIVAALIEG